MKISQHVLNKFAQTPWSITSEGAMFWATTCSYESVPSIRGESTNFMGDTIPEMTIVQGVSIVPICCPALVHGASAIEKGFGAQSHSDISEMLEEAEANASTGILLNFSCPGGTVTGTPELASQIAALTKPCFAFSDSTCCSSAFWLANAASCGFYVTSCAMVGSVGCIAQVQTIADMLAAAGISISTFTSGNLKSAGNPFKAMTDAERGHFQGLVNLMGLKFKSAIRAKRPGVGDADMEGQSFLGSDAVTRGIADGVVSGMSEVLAMIGPGNGKAASGAEQEWRADANLRREFSSFAVYSAFRQAERQGRVFVSQRGGTEATTSRRPAPKLSPAIAPAVTGRDYAAQFSASRELQAEFTTVECYTAFMKAQRGGHIKLKK